MQDLADKFIELESEVERLLKSGEDIKDLHKPENQEQLSDIMEAVGIVMKEIEELEIEYNKRSEEIRNK